MNILLLMYYSPFIQKMIEIVIDNLVWFTGSHVFSFEKNTLNLP
jgi:hypothetical protein